MESLLRCPNCKSEMTKVKEPDITIDRCEKCGGVFLDKGGLNILTTGMAGDIEFCSIDQETHKDRFVIRNCPKCPNQTMRKINLLAYSDTIFDFCPLCEGFYLDKEELKSANLELESLTKDKEQEEYRGYRDGHLVCLDKINDVTIGSIGAGGLGPLTYTQNLFFLRLSVYFKEALGLGLRIYSEKWTNKISKLMGLFKEQDIQIGNEDLDSVLVIQGKDKQKIQTLLSSKELQKELLNFISSKPKMLKIPPRLEITDKRIILTEGPYTGSGRYDAEKDSSGVAARVIKLALLFEQFDKK